MKISEKGKNFDGEKLTEDNLMADTKIIWRNKIYKTGNRYHNYVDLYHNNIFIRAVNMNHIYLLNE